VKIFKNKIAAPGGNIFLNRFFFLFTESLVTELLMPGHRKMIIEKMDQLLFIGSILIEFLRGSFYRQIKDFTRSTDQFY
jgi:hypothetical protein